jgi:hypothetical protein
MGSRSVQMHQRTRVRTGRGVEHHRERVVLVAVCARCGLTLVLLGEVGWVCRDPSGSYDMCDADPFANHWPREEGAFSGAVADL